MVKYAKLGVAPFQVARPQETISACPLRGSAGQTGDWRLEDLSKLAIPSTQYASNCLRCVAEHTGVTSRDALYRCSGKSSVKHRTVYIRTVRLNLWTPDSPAYSVWRWSGDEETIPQNRFHRSRIPRSRDLALTVQEDRLAITPRERKRQETAGMGRTLVARAQHYRKDRQSSTRFTKSKLANGSPGAPTTSNQINE